MRTLSVLKTVGEKMKSHDADDVQANFAHILDGVAGGEIIEVTRDGVPIAQITRIESDEDRFKDASAAMAAIHRFRHEQRPTLDGMSLRELIEEGRNE
jgi:antitoxin (DNA-binding transcriptional repressor) of toxin-antitoxin stability system